MSDHDRYSTLSSDGGKKIVTKTTTVMPYDVSSGVLPPPGTQEEWTTTKRKVNHKTKQVETRVQRQIIMEDGKVIADSGPTVTTKTTEDQKEDETEDTKHRRLGESEVPEEYRKGIGNQIVSEKTVTHNKMREAKEENYQYHDESLRELEGADVHRKAVEAPHTLISIENELPAVPKGKMVHFSAKGRKINDRDEILEVSRLNKDGLLETETQQTQHHEEYEDDEVPEPGQAIEGSNQRQIEYHRGGYDSDHRTASSLSVSRQDHTRHGNKQWRDRRDSGSESDHNVVETSEVYRLSDKMRSLKTGSSKKSKSGSNKKKSKVRKDDASTQASLSDSDDGHRHRHHHGHLQEVNERFESKKSSFRTPDKCCDPLEKPTSKYYFGSDPTTTTTTNGDHGFISANVKTSRFAMENDKVLEDKTFHEDFERSFKDRNERLDVARDYDRFVEKAKEHTKVRAISPALPPPGPGHEYIHRPMLVDHVPSYDHAPSRSRSFYDHQMSEYESTKSHQHANSNNYTLPPRPSERYRSPSPIPAWNSNSNSNRNVSESKQHHFTSSHHHQDYYSNRRPSYSRSNSRSDFPDFAPLSSPLEIKSLTENATRNSRHISTYH